MMIRISINNWNHSIWKNIPRCLQIILKKLYKNRQLESKLFLLTQNSKKHNLLPNKYN